MLYSAQKIPEYFDLKCTESEILSKIDIIVYTSIIKFTQFFE
jgi:hypothetical protein